MNLNPFLGEAIHGQKYEIGQFYKQHVDYYNEDQMDTYCKWMGQRTWTTMLYLNDVEEGGETNFPKLDVAIKPKCGRILLFPANWQYRHSGLPPVSSQKYIVGSYLHYT